MLAAAGGVLADGLDDALSQALGSKRASLDGLVNPLHAELVLVNVDGLGVAIADVQQGVAGLELVAAG